MNLKFIVEKIIEEGYDEEIVTNFTEICSTNFLQLKAIMLQPLSKGKSKLLYDVLSRLTSCQQIQNFSIILFQSANSSSLNTQIFRVLEHIIFLPNYTGRILYRLLDLWKNNLFRVYCMRLFNKLIQESRFQKQQIFNIIFSQIVLVFPMHVDYKEQRQKAKTIRLLGYFDKLTQLVVQFLILGYRLSSQLSESVICHLLVFIQIQKLSPLIIKVVQEIVTQTKASQKLIKAIVEVMIKYCEFTEQTVFISNQLLKNDTELYCSTVSKSIKESFDHPFQQQHLQNISSHICLSMLHLSPTKATLFLVEWLRLLQMLLEISKNQYKQLVFDTILRVIQSYLPIIKQNNTLKMALSSMIITNLPYSFQTLMLFNINQMISSKLIPELRIKIGSVNDQESRRALWTIVMQNSVIEQYSQIEDYTIVNILGLQIVKNWKIDLDKLMQVHQMALFQNKQEQIQTIELIIGYISHH